MSFIFLRIILTLCYYIAPVVLVISFIALFFGVKYEIDYLRNKNKNTN